MMDKVESTTHAKYDRLIADAQALPPMPTAVAYPCDAVSLEGAIESAQLKLITPILVGPVAKIKAAAQEIGADISKYEIVDARDSHEAAVQAVALVAYGSRRRSRVPQFV